MPDDNVYERLADAERTVAYVTTQMLCLVQEIRVMAGDGVTACEADQRRLDRILGYVDHRLGLLAELDAAQPFLGRGPRRAQSTRGRGTEESKPEDS